MTFGDLHVDFIFKDAPLPERKSVSAVFLVGFIDGQIIAARNERGWDVPGGHVEPSDPDLFAALQREVMEESGVTVRTAMPYAVLCFNSRDDQMLFYASDDCTLGEFAPSADAFERRLMTTDEFVQLYHWKKDVMELLVEGGLRMLVTRLHNSPDSS